MSKREIALLLIHQLHNKESERERTTDGKRLQELLSLSPSACASVSVSLHRLIVCLAIVSLHCPFRLSRRERVSEGAG